jgi:hypothetical protein
LLILTLSSVLLPPIGVVVVACMAATVGLLGIVVWRLDLRRRRKRSDPYAKEVMLADVIGPAERILGLDRVKNQLVLAGLRAFIIGLCLGAPVSTLLKFAPTRGLGGRAREIPNSWSEVVLMTLGWGVIFGLINLVVQWWEQG